MNHPDFQFGLQSEIALTDKIREKFNPKLVKTGFQYAVLDFECDDCLVELKTRKVRKDTYRDTMVGFNKILAARKAGKTCYFVFAFTDGLFYWEYAPDKETDFRVAEGGRSDRGYDQFSTYAFIDCSKLIPF